jgi:pyrroloquinoline quinone biosynthesis protein B
MVRRKTALLVPCALFALAFTAASCRTNRADRVEEPFVVVLGIAQDAGAPQTGCAKACCAERWRDPAKRLHAACLAIVDPASGERWLIDATPDLREQVHRLDELAPVASPGRIDGILLTHAHIGHYLGLAQLGREVQGAHGVPVYAMPRMAAFLQGNGPWSQLVEQRNIDLRRLEAGRATHLNERIEVTPFLVPHRDEFSETVGYRMRVGELRVAWLPDIDKWEAWERPLEDLLAEVDLAFVDGTFFDGGELPGRDLREIPHPFITETIARLAKQPKSVRAKVRFVHMNHSNPALDPRSEASRAIERAGFGVARE